MSAIYIHIPFCKQACYYCDFHFSTSTALKSQMVEAICREIVLQKDYLSEKQLKTIYFGGGTPSLLSEGELGQILDTIHHYFSVEESAEITVEANPDDLTKEKIHTLQKAGINRLSIGIQSFYEPHLKFMHRAHNAHEAEHCVKKAQDAGIINLSIDLIYAIPFENHTILYDDLAKAIALNVPHLSAYCLTIEPKTVLGKWQKTGKIPLIDEEFAAQQFEILIETLTRHGYEHYEISNFAKPNHYSRHNTNYWKTGSYLGIGASAHSYNGESRQYNAANNTLYIKAIAANTIPFEKEILSTTDHINEYLMTSLRTMWGCDALFLQKKYNYAIFEDKQNLKKIMDYQANHLLLITDNQLILTAKGKLLADEIAGSLFVE